MEESNPQPLPLTNEDKDKVIHTLINKVDALEKRVTNIQNEKVLESLQLAKDVAEQCGVVVPPPRRLQRGNGYRPLLESEINEAYGKCENNATEAARLLGVDYKTFKKYAVQYGIWKTNPWRRGSKKRYWDPNKGKYPLNQILEGKFPEYPVFRLKDLLIRSGIKKAECEVCSFGERRITDQKMPLLLNFKDGNEKNHVTDNLQLLCYNCMFLIGRGYVRSGRVKFNYYDPDRIQGASKNIEARF